MAEISFQRNPTITHDYVSEIHVSIDGQAIDSGMLTIPQGKQVTISGTLINNPSRVTTALPVMGNVHVAHRPADSDEESWSSMDFDREWAGPRKERFEYPAKIDLDPGQYDLRVYVTNLPFEDGLPHVEYVAQGQLTVIPATQPTHP